MIFHARAFILQSHQIPNDLGSNVPLFEILLGSVILPPESVAAVQPVSKSIELILL